MAKTFSKDTFHQGQLEKVIRSLFGDNSVRTNVKKEGKLVNPTTGYYLELDVWVPEHNISFEFQDPYHYITTWDSQVPLVNIQQQDALKLEKLQKKGETLIYVPCWWEGSKESIISTVKFHRPDLLRHLSSKSLPTSLNPTPSYFDLSGVPGVGELMVASFPVSLKFRKIFQDAAWWLGEKYDGIRVCWHPHRKRLYTRYGYSLVVIPKFVDWLVGIYLDSEIWFGRGNFPYTQRLIKSDVDSIDWSFVRFIAFDDATPKHEYDEFEVRYQRIMDNIFASHPFIKVAVRVQCKTAQQLVRLTDEIINFGGEGAILRRNRSFYEHGRSTNLLKIKASRGDKEAIVTTVWPDGSYTLKQPDGTKFRVPVHKLNIDTKKLIRGDIVTFTYDTVTNSARPVNPRIFRIRTDLSWEEIVSNYYRDKSRKLNESSQRMAGFKKKPLGYWTSEQGKNMRAFLVKFAQDKNIDPLEPETWYAVSRKDIEQTKGGTSVLNTVKGGLVHTIMSLFPDIGLEREKFDLYPSEHWLDPDNRRKIFLDYAKRKGFDPLKAFNWYSQSKRNFLSIKGLRQVVQFYNKSIIQTMVHLFPEIGLESSKFITIRKWYDPLKRRKFFIDFAHAKGFDPLLAANWYSVPIDSVISYPGGLSVLTYHKRSLINALVELFPNLNLDTRKFAVVPHNYWRSKDNRRNVFDEYARARGFSPLVASNWYAVPSDKVFAAKRISSVLNYYPDRSVVKALIDVYPELNLKEDRFVANIQKRWQDVRNRKQFFVEFAKAKGFDPLVATNWYPVTLDMFSGVQDADVVLGHYTGCHIIALLNIFPTIGLDVDKFSVRPLRHWQSEDNRRQFFVDLAEGEAFDPYVPDNWYSITKRDLLNYKETETVLAHYRGSFPTAVIILFPNIGLDKNKFSILPKNYWTNVENRKLFFEQVASDLGFAAGDVGAWYKITSDDLLKRKGGRAILVYYRGSLAKALEDVFPGIKLDAPKFAIVPSTFVLDMENRRKVIENFAKEKGFDPLLATNWYHIKRDTVTSIRGIQSLLAGHFKGNYAKMLTQIFPDIGLEERRFQLRKSHLKEEGDRRDFLNKFANEMGFDPLVPRNWIGQRDKFSARKGAASLLAHYGGSLTKALEHLYRDIVEIR